jgi:L-Ala-D/L-Glu epimerase
LRDCVTDHITPLTVSARQEAWPLKNPFVISRGSKTVADVVVATVTDGVHIGRGEAVPYARYGETVQGVIAAIEGAKFGDRLELQGVLPPGAARNALDCAMWELEAKKNHTTVASRAGNGTTPPLLTAFTLSLGTPAEMAASARAVPHLPLLKLKLGGAGDPDRMRAVRAARPDARLMVDANESWTPDMLHPFLAAARETHIELIEQPLPVGKDDVLLDLPIPHDIIICADESVHTVADLPKLGFRYSAINIKLDKAGGLTAAYDLWRAAKQQSFKTMVGSMVSTSLAVAPAFILAQDADWVDLDGPLLLAQDRVPGFSSHNGIMSPPDDGLWG